MKTPAEIMIEGDTNAAVTRLIDDTADDIIKSTNSPRLIAVIGIGVIQALGLIAIAVDRGLTSHRTDGTALDDVSLQVDKLVDEVAAARHR